MRGVRKHLAVTFSGCDNCWKSFFKCFKNFPRLSIFSFIFPRSNAARIALPGVPHTFLRRGKNESLVLGGFSHTCTCGAVFSSERTSYIKKISKVRGTSHLSLLRRPERCSTLTGGSRGSRRNQTDGAGTFATVGHADRFLQKMTRIIFINIFRSAHACALWHHHAP